MQLDNHKNFKKGLLDHLIATTNEKCCLYYINSKVF